MLSGASTLHKIALLIACCLLFVFIAPSCSPAGDNDHVIHYKMGNHDLYIPQVYVHFSHTSVGHESGLIQAYYPGAAPVLKDPGILLDEHKWFKNVLILFDDIDQMSDFNFTRGFEATEDLTKANTIASYEYGLIHQTQPDGLKKDSDDIWVERDGQKLISFIQCSKKYASGVIPQCTHKTHDKDFLYTITYDKRLLPQWKLIRTNVFALMQSFTSENRAKSFLIDQTSDTYPIQIGENDGHARHD